MNCRGICISEAASCKDHVPQVCCRCGRRDFEAPLFGICDESGKITAYLCKLCNDQFALPKSHKRIGFFIKRVLAAFKNKAT